MEKLDFAAPKELDMAASVVWRLVHVQQATRKPLKYWSPQNLRSTADRKLELEKAGVWRENNFQSDL